MSVDAVDEWRARDHRRNAPDLDYGQRWTSNRLPGVEWRVSWNTGTGEVFAARCDRTDLHVLGIAETLAHVVSALQGWRANVDRHDGLEWVFAQTRQLTGDGELSVQLARLRAGLSVIEPAPDSVGRDGLSVEL